MHTCRSCASDWSVDVFGIFDMFGMTCDNERRHLKRESEAMCNLNASIWSFKHQRKCFVDLMTTFHPNNPGIHPNDRGIHENFDYGVNLLWYFWKLHTCVEAKILPEGPPRLNDRGECCAPFSLKNVFRHPRHSPKRPGDSLENLQFWVSKFTQKPKKT